MIMGWGRGPDTTELPNVMKLVGLYYTVPPSELRALRKTWVQAWKSTRISAPDFVVQHYGIGLDDGDLVPTRGAALTAPLHWEQSDGIGPVGARRFVEDVLAGKFRSV